MEILGQPYSRADHLSLEPSGYKFCCNSECHSSTLFAIHVALWNCMPLEDIGTMRLMYRMTAHGGSCVIETLRNWNIVQLDVKIC